MIPCSPYQFIAYPNDESSLINIELFKIPLAPFSQYTSLPYSAELLTNIESFNNPFGPIHTTDPPEP